MVKVSIIIPAYNIQDYIERCLNSCISQSFNDIEIIIVNDGSTDKTLEKINKFKHKDSRIVVINKENNGVNEARKSGLKIAKGDYILFVDGDDYIEDKTIEVLYTKAIKGNYDIVQYKWIYKYDNGVEKKYKKHLYEKVENKSLLELLLQCEIPPSIWSKFIKREFMEENNIEFLDGISYAEDVAFTCMLAMHNPSYTVIDEYLYYYCRRDGSLDNIISNNMLDTEKVILSIKEELKKHNLFKLYKEEFNYMAYMHCYYYKKEYIFNGKINKLSKQLFSVWRNLNININCKNNKFYKRLYINDSPKALIIDGICKKNYFFGHLYYKIKNHVSL